MIYLKRFYNAMVYMVFHLVYLVIMLPQMVIYVATGKEMIYPPLVRLQLKLYIKNIIKYDQPIDAQIKPGKVHQKKL